ncbi:MAG: tetratricopeptide repeat protein [Verrucomicrobiota bacterium]|nr:tetratricopeptide repeat protein [Verrucomicrobiota bacterium]
MTFPAWRTSRLFSVFLAVVFALGGEACHRALTPEEKQTRAELRQALQDHSYDRAAELAAQVVAARPRENGAWERLVRAQLGRRDFASAKQTLVRWRAAVHKPSAMLEEFTGDIAAEEQDYSTATAAWKRALAVNQKRPQLLRKLARAQHAQRQWPEENATLTTLLALEDQVDDRMARANSFRRLHRWAEALEDFRRAEKLAPNNPEVQQGLKLFARLSKFLAEMKELDARLAVTPHDDQLLGDRALLFLRSGDPELACEDAEAALKTAPWAIRPRLLQAIALLQLGQTAEAEQLHVDPALRLERLSSEFLQTVSRLDSEISVERSNAELYVARAWQLNDCGQPALALEDTETARRFDANSAGAHAESAYALAKLGRADEALERVKRATELDPNFSTGWHYRGELEMARGDFVAAVDSLSRALAINQTAAALQKREACYRQIGLLTKADEDHRALEKLESHSSGS